MDGFISDVGELRDAHLDTINSELNPGTITRIESAVDKINKAADAIERTTLSETIKNFIENPKVEFTGDPPELKMMKGRLLKSEILFDGKSLGDRFAKFDADIKETGAKTTTLDSFSKGVESLSKSFGKEFADNMGTPALADGFAEVFYKKTMDKVNVDALNPLVKADMIYEGKMTAEELKTPGGAKKAAKIFNDELDKRGIDKTKFENILRDEKTLNKMIDDRIEKSKDNPEKTMWKSFKDYVKENWLKILLVGGIAGFFSYELFERMAKLNSGCIVTVQPNDGEISQCKIFSLTCDPDLRIGSRCPSKYPIYTTPLPELPAGIVPYKSGASPSENEIGLPDTTTVCNKKINNNKCSALCDPKYLISKDANNTYEYTCADLNVFDAFNKFSSKLLDVAAAVVNAPADIFGSIKKYVAIFIYVVIGLFILSKLIPFFIKSKDDPSHGFRSVRFNV